eukprot:1798011-Rhodomonas_salina.1
MDKRLEVLDDNVMDRMCGFKKKGEAQPEAEADGDVVFIGKRTEQEWKARLGRPAAAEDIAGDGWKQSKNVKGTVTPWKDPWSFKGGAAAKGESGGGKEE